MKFEERRPVRSAFAGTAGGFVTVARPESTAPALNETGTRPTRPLTADATTLPERR